MFEDIIKRLSKFEKFFRFPRNVILLIKILFSTKPNNFKAINDLHKSQLELKKCKSKIANLIKSLIFADDENLVLSKQAEYSIFSQHGEDGITLKLLNRINLNYGRFIEFGAGGYSSNTQILASMGWAGACIDGNSYDLDVAKKSFEERQIDIRNIKFSKAWITKNNINDVIDDNVAGEIDLLSIDLDGVDYWLLEAVTPKPKIIILEYNASFGPDEILSVPYTDDFYRWDGKFSPKGWYYGASLRAYDRLMRTKGYQLIYCESSGVNAFYLRNDIGQKYQIPIKSIEEAFYPDISRTKGTTVCEQLAHLKAYELINL